MKIEFTREEIIFLLRAISSRQRLCGKRRKKCQEAGETLDAMSHLCEQETGSAVSAKLLACGLSITQGEGVSN